MQWPVLSKGLVRGIGEDCGMCLSVLCVCPSPVVTTLNCRGHMISTTSRTLSNSLKLASWTMQLSFCLPVYDDKLKPLFCNLASGFQLISICIQWFFFKLKKWWTQHYSVFGVRLVCGFALLLTGSRLILGYHYCNHGKEIKLISKLVIVILPSGWRTERDR